MPQQVALMIETAMDKLIDSSKVTQNRMGVKAAEEKRVSEAFGLPVEGVSPENSKGAKQRVIYLDFLQRV